MFSTTESHFQYPLAAIMLLRAVRDGRRVKCRSTELTHDLRPGTGIAPGSGAGVAPADPKNGGNIKITFEASRIGDPPPPLYTNALNRVRINNWQEVNQLNLQQFLSGGSGSCSGLSSSLNILYTADHELMGSFSIDITSAASFPKPPLPSGTGPRGGVGSAPPPQPPPPTPPITSYDISTSPSCSYQVWL